MQQIVLTLHVFIAVALITLVLLQQGKGAEAGAAFGGGASQTFFGSQGSSSFLLKLTAGLAFAFFVTSISLTRLAAQESPQPQGQILPIQQPSQAEQEPQQPAPETKQEKKQQPEALGNIPGLAAGNKEAAE